MRNQRTKLLLLINSVHQVEDLGGYLLITKALLDHQKALFDTLLDQVLVVLVSLDSLDSLEELVLPYLSCILDIQMVEEHLDLLHILSLEVLEIG